MEPTTEEILAKYGSTFRAGDINDPRVNPELRKRIALELMSQRRTAPKNVGEGFNAIGEAIGDRRVSDRLMAADAAATQRAGVTTDALVPPTGTPAPAVATPPPQRTSYAPEDPPVNPTVTAAVTPPPPAPPVGGVSRSITPPADPNELPPATYGDGGGISAPGTPIPDLGARSRAALLLANRNAAAGGPPTLPPAQAGEASPAALPVTLAGTSTPDGGDDALAGGGDTSHGIRPAPKVAVPTRVQAEFGHVMDEPQRAAHPQQVPMSPREQELRSALRRDPYNTVLQNNLAPFIKQEVDKRAAKQELLNKDYERAETLRSDLLKKRQEQLENQADRQIKGREAVYTQQQKEEKDRFERRLGQPVDKFVENFKPQHVEAQRQSSALNSIREVESAIKAGAITGIGRNYRVNAERMKAWLLSSNSSENVAAASERLSAMLSNTVPLAIAKVQPGDSRITEGDIIQAKGMSGSPDMQAASILKLMRLAKQDVYERLDAFEEQRHKKIGGHPLEDSFRYSFRNFASEASVARLLEKQNDPKERQMFDEAFGDGAADLMINRARRTREAAERPAR